MEATYYEALRSEADAIARLRIGLQTVIPAVLDAQQHPKRDSTTWEPLLDAKTGLALPAFCGKNPSFWFGPNQPRLDKPNRSLPVEEVIQRINNAEQWEQPIGLAAIPDQNIAILDFDLKNYESETSLKEDIERLLKNNEYLAETRIELTPSGGRHIWIEVEDWSEWQTSSAGLHCNFRTSEGGSHRGEVIAGGRRICVCAPTEREDGAYTLLQAANRNKIVGFASLSAIGIYPTAARQPSGNGQHGRIIFPQGEEKLQMQPGTVDDLKKFLTKKAIAVLDGQFPYSAPDRSGTLTAFANELISWNNIAAEQGYTFDDVVMSLIEEAAEALGCSEKLDRIVNSLRFDKSFDDHEWATRRFVKIVLEDGDDTLNLGGYDNALSWNEDEAMEGQEINQEIEELVSLPQCDEDSVEKLIPEYLRDSLAVIRENLEYNWSLMVAILLAGLSGALPLRSEINLMVSNFKQPLSLFLLVLMPSGAAKTPVINQLATQPWKQSVEPIMKDRYQNELKRCRELKENSEKQGDDEDISRPRRAQTMITEDFTPQGIECRFISHSNYANGSVLLLIDEGKGILKEMSGQPTSTNQLKLGQWILSRYDGTGGQGAKADETRERNYEECRLAVLMCCQPGPYRKITGDADQTGLAGRFIVVEQLAVKQHFAEKLDEAQNKRHEVLARLLIDLYRFFCDRDEIYVELGREALSLFQQERKKLDDLKNQSLSDAAQSIYSKCAGRIGRLAGLFHILWSFDPVYPLRRAIPSRVGADSMERAIALNRILLSGSILARETSDGNDEEMNRMYQLHSMASRVSGPISLGRLKKKFNSSKRWPMKEYIRIATALRQRGCGLLTQDANGNHYYEVLKPFKG